jgi:hypothetical protein
MTPEQVAKSLPPLSDSQCARIAALLSLSESREEVAS